MPEPGDDRFIPPHGGYEKLLSYQKALIVFQGTVFFTRKWFTSRDRTIDQMVQAARSGKQNIVEGSEASATSKEMELKLTNVARSSQGELREDYRDFLMTRGLREWPEDHRFSQRLRELNRKPGAVYADFQKGIESDDPEIAANVLLGLVKVTHFLLGRQVQALEKAFLEEGGLKERMSRVRRTVREREEGKGQMRQKGQKGRGR